MTDPCYLLVTTPPLNYADAEAACQSQGGVLADIRSQAENNLIFTLTVSQSVLYSSKLQNENKTF
jgi:hypothetical protein